MFFCIFINIRKCLMVEKNSRLATLVFALFISPNMETVLFLLFRVNAVSNGQLRGEAFTTGCLGVRGARVWFFFGFLMGFGALIGACWILFGEYLIASESFKNRVHFAI